MDSEIVVPSPERIKQDVDHLKDWLSKKPHLPKIENSEWLETFLYNNKFSLEKTKFKLENYYSMRTKYPEILKNRDPTSPDTRRCLESIKFALSDRLTKDKTRVLFFKCLANDTFDIETFPKRLFMIYDLLLLDKENRPTQIFLVADMQDFKYSHLLKLMSALAKVSEIFHSAYTERLKTFLFINFPSFAGTVVDLLKKLSPPKFADRIRIDTPKNSLLFDLLDKDVVCSDFGGTGPSLDELQDLMQKDLEKYKAWFEEQEDVCSNESLRQKEDKQPADLVGSFKKFDVD